jgi:hypothetical protein
MIRETMKRRLLATTFLGLAVAAAPLGGLRNAYAVDTQAHDFLPLPAGTNIALGYYILGNYEEYDPLGAAAIKNNTHVQAQVGLARYVRYYDIGNVRFLTSIYQVFGGYSNARIGGTELQTPGVQLGDLSIDTFAWVINNPDKGQYWALGGYIHIPDGGWNRNVATNLGDNRFSGTVQTGYIQRVLPKLDVELVGDATFYTDNTQAPITGGTLSQQPSYEGQMWLNYKLTQVDTASFGFTGNLGGYSSVNGVATGSKTESEELRFSGSHFFVKPGIQVLVEAVHDLHVVGGFNENIGLMVRVAKVF